MTEYKDVTFRIGCQEEKNSDKSLQLNDPFRCNAIAGCAAYGVSPLQTRSSTRRTSGSIWPLSISHHIFQSARKDQRGYLNVAGLLRSMKK